MGVTVHWRCRQSPDEKLMDPGRCGDGSVERPSTWFAHMVITTRATVACSSWHRMPGITWKARIHGPASSACYFYDNFTQPIAAKGFAARLVLREEFDTATNTLKELEVIPLRPGSEINTLDATLKGDRPPLKVTVKVKFDPNSREHRFDFGFSEYSIDSSSKR